MNDGDYRMFNPSPIGEADNILPNGWLPAGWQLAEASSMDILLLLPYVCRVSPICGPLGGLGKYGVMEGFGMICYKRTGQSDDITASDIYFAFGHDHPFLTSVTLPLMIFLVFSFMRSLLYVGLYSHTASQYASIKKSGYLFKEYCVESQQVP
jgi:hypothetical protein